MGIEDRDWYRELHKERQQKYTPVDPPNPDPEGWTTREPLAGKRPYGSRRGLTGGSVILMCAIGAGGYYLGQHPELFSEEGRAKAGESINALFDSAARKLSQSKAGTERRNAPKLARHKPMLQDPHGNPWPDTSGYLVGTPVLNATGKSEFTFENAASERYLIHLVDIEQSPNIVVRQLYLGAGESFTMRSIKPGRYLVRHSSLRTGENQELKKVFEFTAKRVPNGYAYSRAKVILDTMDGNIRTEHIEQAMITGKKVVM